MTCPRCQRRTLTNYTEQWCLVCGTVEAKPSREAHEAARTERTRERYMGLRKHSMEVEA